jgi:hypothetical protein
MVSTSNKYMATGPTVPAVSFCSALLCKQSESKRKQCRKVVRVEKEAVVKGRQLVKRRLKQTAVIRKIYQLEEL